MTKKVYQDSVTEEKAFLKGALIYAYGTDAASDTEVLAAVWDRYRDLIDNENCSQDIALHRSVSEINLAAFNIHSV